MKQAAMIGAVLAVATWSFAQSNSKPTTQSQPPAQATSPAAGATSSKRPPQAKTQPEYEAYKTAIALTDAAASEKAADDFATKFPDSELRIMLYKSTMRLYQRAGNSEICQRWTYGADDDSLRCISGNDKSSNHRIITG